MPPIRRRRHESPGLVDTHQHLWDLAQFPYTWCTGIPALNRSFSQADYTAAADGLGIVKTVFMECDVDEPHVLAEALHVQSLAGRDPSIAGIVAGCRPEMRDLQTISPSWPGFPG